MEHSSTQYAPRNPTVALVFSLLTPGLGHVYVGQPSKGVLLFLGLLLSIPLSAYLSLKFPSAYMAIVLLLGIVAGLTIYGYAAVSAMRTAKTLSPNYRLNELNKTYIYILVLFFGNLFFVYHTQFNITRQYFVEPYRIPSNSMRPTIHNGDFILANKRVNCIGCKTQLKRGDVAIFINPNNRTQLYIKRIVGLPGDRIDMRNGVLWVNKKLVSQLSKSKPYRRINKAKNKNSAKPYQKTSLNLGYNQVPEQLDNARYNTLTRKTSKKPSFQLTVPNGRVFALGDNRDASHDSRAVGSIPLADIVGVATQVWLNYSSESGFQWGRIGTSLQPASKP